VGRWLGDSNKTGFFSWHFAMDRYVFGWGVCWAAGWTVGCWYSGRLSSGSDVLHCFLALFLVCLLASQLACSPKLCRLYFALLSYMLEIFPEQVGWVVVVGGSSKSWWGVVRGSVTLLGGQIGFEPMPTAARGGGRAGGGCRGTRRERGALEGFGEGGWPKPTRCRGEQVGAWTLEGGRGRGMPRNAPGEGRAVVWRCWFGGFCCGRRVSPCRWSTSRWFNT
jgi:hypothetical protein